MPADAPSLWDPFDRASGHSDLLRTWEGDRYEAASWKKWRERANRFGGGLRRIGVAPGDRVAFLLTNSFEACAGVIGAWVAGACAVSLPAMARGVQPQNYALQLRRIVGQAEPTVVIASDEIAAVLAQAQLGVPVLDYSAIDASPIAEPSFPAPDGAAFVQYSSGSTTEPKGAVLTSDAIARQLAALEAALEIDAERDTGVVWLPLSHDMGLFGCALLTYWTGHRVVLGTPQRFLTQPWTWLEDCAAFGATVSAAPGFALEMATRLGTKRMPGPFPMRKLVLGGERIEPAPLARATQLLGPDRLPSTALLPAYGLSEAVLAVTFTDVGEGPTTLSVDAEALARGLVQEPSRSSGSTPTELTAAGRPLPGCHVTIDAPVGADIGEVVVRSPSLARGYLARPELTADRFGPDGLRTGDLGFVHDGRLFITGRQDDLVSLAGRNVYMRDLEMSLAEVSGIRPGKCAVVDVRDAGGSALVALIEPRGRSDFAAMADEAGRAVRRFAGVHLHRCLFLLRGQLPKTPSGKLQRFRCREIAAADGGDGTAVVHL